MTGLQAAFHLAADRWCAITIIVCYKSVPLFAMAGFAAFMHRRASADVRHRLWLFALAGMLALPVATMLLPNGPVRVPIYVAGIPVRPPAVRMTPASLQVDSSVPLWARAPSGPRSAVKPAGRSDGTAGLSPFRRVREATSPDRAGRLIPYPRHAPAVTFGEWLFLLWLTAGFGIGLSFVIGWVHAVRQARRCSREGPGPLAPLCAALSREIGLARPVDLRVATGEGPACRPMTWGHIRPILLLPAGAPDWTLSRQRAVLLHELAHIRRCDWLSLLLAHAACITFWFHPLVWYAAQALRLEAERACDDCVLASGMPPSRYARDLLEIVQMIKIKERSTGASIAMARRSGLEERLRSILDPGRKRAGLSRGRSWLLSAGALATVGALAALSPRIARPDAGLSGPKPDVWATETRETRSKITASEQPSVTRVDVTRKASDGSSISTDSQDRGRTGLHAGEAAIRPVRGTAARRPARGRRDHEVSAERQATQLKAAAEAAATGAQIQALRQQLALEDSRAALAEQQYRTGMITRFDRDEAMRGREHVRVELASAERRSADLQHARSSRPSRSGRDTEARIRSLQDRLAHLEIDRRAADESLQRAQTQYQAGIVPRSSLDDARSRRDSLTRESESLRAYLRGYQDAVAEVGPAGEPASRSSQEATARFLDEKRTDLEAQLSGLEADRQVLQARLTGLRARRHVGTASASDLQEVEAQQAGLDARIAALSRDLAAVSARQSEIMSR